MGTNRFVLLLRDKAIKIPMHPRGVRANQAEYDNFLKAPKGCVAEMRVKGIFLIQERLTDIEIYPQGTRREQIPAYARGLFDIKLTNRLQIGKDNFGRWKIFDYEDVKKWEEKAYVHQS